MSEPRTLNGEKKISSKNDIGNTGYLHVKKEKLDPYFTPLLYVPESPNKEERV